MQGVFASLLTNLPSTWHHENEILTRSRKRRVIRWNNTLLRSPSGDVVGTASIGEDITERKRTESALQESEERFRAMIEQSISGTCIIDAEQRFAYVNPRLATILGHESSASIVGQPVVDFVAPDDHALVAENMRQRMAGEAQSARYHFRAIRKDGSHVTLGAHGTIGSYAGQRVVIATVQDVTELRRAEEEIEHTVAKLQRAMQSAIEVVSTIGELRDPYTHGHERRVGEIATAIAIEMGLPADRIEGIRVAGYLHDVGKIAVPAEILSKPTRLSKIEFELVKTHAQQSYEILKGMEFPWPVAESVWQHHERLDGSGYPRGLKHDEINLEARVLAVADTVEAMASHRPYRAGLGLGAALIEIERNRGKLYDPTVVDACLQLFRLKGYQLPA
jgi:PAS domain S-box-containing protein